MAPRLIRRITDRLRNAIANALIGLVRLYQWGISPWLGPRCRFEPTCSGYAITAIRRHGPARGGLLAVRRLSRCHPWGASGYDPVPEDLEKDNRTS
jgi:putative membrane protein insertion efficiency factor